MHARPPARMQARMRGRPRPRPRPAPTRSGLSGQHGVLRVVGLHLPPHREDRVDDELRRVRHDARQDEEARLGPEVRGQRLQHRDADREGLLAAHEDDGHPLLRRQAGGGGDKVAEEAVDQVDRRRERQAEREVLAAGREDGRLRLRDHEQHHEQDAAVLGEAQRLLVARRKLAQGLDEAPQGHADAEGHERQPDQLVQHLPGAHLDGRGEDLRR
mmetsp:Transcript_119967/g.373640  ORF Transcript_119967/g.373640 Transcript_119967/m.373640 type:complete len:215 (+) Transcript_119967:15-659(+)